MKCANCVYYENDVCYKRGTRVSYNNNICEKFVKNNIFNRDGLEMNLKK